MKTTRYSTRRAGQAMVEYALLLGLLGSGVLAIVITMGASAANAYQATAAAMMEADAVDTAVPSNEPVVPQPIAESPAVSATSTTSTASTASDQPPAEAPALGEGVGFGPSMSAGPTTGNNGNHYGQLGQAPANANGAGNGQGNSAS